ncbi:MAG: hypothetical protein M1820_010282 [Bogoriella megaspora]|nr:MAG: hypothetical protein M1820_010282 [Bogoriella megaspora]
MYKLSLLNLLSLLPSIVLCHPASTTSTASPAAPSPTVANTTQSFHLRTQAIDPSNKLFDGYYFQTYHTGAGFNDVALIQGSASDGAVGFLNGTADTVDPTGAVGYYADFDLGGEFPYGIDATVYAPYQGWSNVEVNAGQQTAGFLIKEDVGLVWNYTSFGGWLDGMVCANEALNSV